MEAKLLEPEVGVAGVPSGNSAADSGVTFLD